MGQPDSSPSLDRSAPSPRHAPLTIRTAHEHGVYVLALYGELDIATANDVDRAIHRAETTDAQEIILDLSGLQFIDSTGIRSVITADARSRSDGNRLSILRGPDQVHRVFELCGLVAELPFAN